MPNYENRCCPECLFDWDECDCVQECSECGSLNYARDVCECKLDLDDYDGQPDEYTEWQDYYGGDDWDHGQYDGDCEPLWGEW